MHTIEAINLGLVMDLDGQPHDEASLEHDLIGLDQVDLEGPLKVGEKISVATSTIGENVLVKPEAYVERAIIEARSVIGQGAHVFQSLVKSGASIGQRSRLQVGSIIGPDVIIPPEVQLQRAVIPTSKTIIALSTFGESLRTVTVHGGFEGPLYSAGCQYSIAWERFEQRVLSAEETTRESAEQYERYLPVFKAIGVEVQHYFEESREHALDLTYEYVASFADRPEPLL